MYINLDYRNKRGNKRGELPAGETLVIIILVLAFGVIIFMASRGILSRLLG